MEKRSRIQMQRNQKNQKKLNEALSYLKRLFNRNVYSENEIRKKLSLKGFDDVVEETIAILKQLGMLNDEKFARYLASNIAEFKKYGPNRIRNMLIAKGYDEFLVDDVISELDVDFAKMATDNARLFLKKRHFKNSYEARRKLYSHLIYKGFSAETIEETLKEIKEEDK